MKLEIAKTQKIVKKIKFDCSRVQKFCCLENDIGFLMWQVVNLLKRDLNSKLAAFGITHLQFQILSAIAWLTRKGEAATQIELAKFSKIDAMMISQVIKLLEKKNLVIRKQHESDSRAKAIFLSESGYKLLNKAIEIVDESSQENFNQIDQKKLQKILMQLFRQLSKNMEDE
jgi:DNA-binding MarR family transcriptional regulator